jgi:hypothetical protein
MDDLQIVAVSASATFKVRYIGDYIGDCWLFYHKPILSDCLTDQLDSVSL